MINWPNGKNFYYHNGWWHGNMASYYVTRRKVTIIALSNKYDKRVYKKIIGFVWDYPFN
jgi:hypothetical protein